eukprot:scaffold326755_cov24-Attheya_sp.AAC.1
MAGQFQSPVELAKGKQKCSKKSKTPFVPNMSHKKKRGKVNRSLMRPAAWMDLHPFAPVGKGCTSRLWRRLVEGDN